MKKYTGINIETSMSTTNMFNSIDDYLNSNTNYLIVLLDFEGANGASHMAVLSAWDGVFSLLSKNGADSWGGLYGTSLKPQVGTGEDVYTTLSDFLLDKDESEVRYDIALAIPIGSPDTQTLQNAEIAMTNQVNRPYRVSSDACPHTVVAGLSVIYPQSGIGDLVGKMIIPRGFFISLYKQNKSRTILLPLNVYRK